MKANSHKSFVEIEALLKCAYSCQLSNRGKPIQNMIAWRVKVFYNRNKAISCLSGIGNFSRAIYRLGY